MKKGQVFAPRNIFISRISISDARGRARKVVRCIPFFAKKERRASNPGSDNPTISASRVAGVACWCLRKRGSRHVTGRHCTVIQEVQPSTGVVDGEFFKVREEGV